jgi:hypothetical protein
MPNKDEGYIGKQPFDLGLQIANCRLPLILGLRLAECKSVDGP